MQALEHMMGAYFHQDWVEDGGTVEDTVNAFLNEPPEVTSQVVTDIDTLLGSVHAEGELSAALTEMGCDYDAGESDDDYRRWLLQLRQLLLAAKAAT
jgi:CdiI immunity protein